MDNRRTGIAIAQVQRVRACLAFKLHASSSPSCRDTQHRFHIKPNTTSDLLLNRTNHSSHTHLSASTGQRQDKSIRSALSVQTNRRPRGENSDQSPQQDRGKTNQRWLNESTLHTFAMWREFRFWDNFLPSVEVWNFRREQFSTISRSMKFQ